MSKVIVNNQSIALKTAHKIEFVFFCGGITLILFSALLFSLCSLVFVENNLCQSTSATFDLLGLVSGISFGILNFRIWKALVLSIISKREEDSRFPTFIFFNLKLLLILMFLAFLYLNSSKFAFSLFLGFTSYLFVGIVLAAIAHKSFN